MLRSDYEWSKEEIEILKNNYGKILVRDITKLLPKRNYGGVRHQIIKLGLHKQFNLRRYSINKHCFSNYNLQSCYWAGFLAADGCITNKNRLSLGLKVSDKEHIDKFVNFMEYTNTTKVYKNVSSISVNCDLICNDLIENFNIVPRKSKILKPPEKIKDDDLIAAFIKGVIDGDGSVMRNEIVIYGTKELLDWIKVYFDKWIPKSNYKLSEVRKIQEHLHAYKIGGKRKNYIFNKLKNLKCDELKRKW